MPRNPLMNFSKEMKAVQASQQESGEAVTPVLETNSGLLSSIVTQLNSIEANVACINQKVSEFDSDKTQNTSMPSDFETRLENKLNERQKRFEAQDKADGKLSINDYGKQVADAVDKCATRHNQAITVLEEYSKNMSAVCGRLTTIEDGIKALSNQIAVATAPQAVEDEPLVFPTIPPKDGNWGKLIFYDLIVWICARLSRSKTVPKLITFCAWLTALLAAFTLIFVCRDNTYLRQENAQLRQTQEKYILLRRAARYDKEMSKNADYIEFLYTDPEHYRDEINRLLQLTK